MNKDHHSLICTVCGGGMSRVKVLPKELGSVIRYKCTCGHCEDLAEERRSERLAVERPEEAFVLEGFQELP